MGTAPKNSYELLTLDANGQATTRRLRDGNMLGYGYDALGRVVSLTTAHLTTDDQDMSYSYDNLGHLTLAAKNAVNRTTLTWDALGRRTGESNYYYALSYGYDAGGRRVRETWNDGFYVTYDYDALSEMTAIRENGGFVLAAFGYDDLGRRTSLTRGNGTGTSYGYDGASRLASLSQDLSGTASDFAATFGYNAAGQIGSRTQANPAYAWTGAVAVDRGYGVNVLNQYTSAGATTFGYDARGNLTSSAGSTYGYTSQNRLATTPGGGYLFADSLERHDTVSPEGVQLAHDGAEIASETSSGNPTGAILRRYVYGPGSDEPLIWYEGSGTGDRRWLHADERGSIVAVSDGSGTKLAINTYDEYGIPASGNLGRFQYTGQAYYPSIGLYDYKARMYSPTLGRFLQTDPIGYADGMNLYAYVGNDPVNFVDPSGMAAVTCGDGTHFTAQQVRDHGNNDPCEGHGNPDDATIEVTGGGGGVTGNLAAFLGGTYDGPPIIVNGKRPTPQKKQPNPKPAPYNPKIQYCGAEGGAGFPGGTWNKACYTHDVCYATSGASRAQCDAQLAADIRQQCEASDPGDPTCSNAAFIYYWAVRFGGAGPFERAQRGKK